MSEPCHEAEADRNDVLSDFRTVRIAASYASYGQCQGLDTNGLILLSREVLSELRAAGLTESLLFHRVEQFHDDALESERRLCSELAALFPTDGEL